MNDEGLGVFYCPKLDMIFVEGYPVDNDDYMLFEGPNTTDKKSGKKWLWTTVDWENANKFVKIGEL